MSTISLKLKSNFDRVKDISDNKDEVRVGQEDTLRLAGPGQEYFIYKVAGGACR